MLSRVSTRYRGLKRLFSRSAWLVRLLKLPVAATPQDGDHHAGLLMIQIDGLSEHEFDRAQARGEMPFLSRLLTHEHYHQQSLYSGLPSSTPAVQGELFYGVSCAVPAFAFLNRDSNQIERMFDAPVGRRVESELAQCGEPLLTGGSAYCNIYTGGAAEAHFCVPSLGFDEIFKQNSFFDLVSDRFVEYSHYDQNHGIAAVRAGSWFIRSS